MPVRDDSLVAQYIRAIENPDSVGYKNGRWYQPDLPGYDINNRGFGVDVIYNKDANALTQNRDNRWLTEEEERKLRNSHINRSIKAIEKKAPPYILRIPPSEEKEAMAVGMLYRGDSVMQNPTVRDAYLTGSNEDMQKAVSDYYQSKKVSERAQRHNQFFNSQKKNTPNNVPASIKRPTPYTPPKFTNEQFIPGKKYDDGGYLGNDWDSLSYKDKAEMMKVAIANGITTLPEIRSAYNEFAKGGKMNWTIQDEAGYRYWRSRLPRNLRETNDNDYDMRAAYKAGMEPQWDNEDKSYHLGSRDPQSGKILKAAHHPTFLKALATDASLGYYPTTDYNGNTYTETWKRNTYGGGGHLNNSQRAMNYLMSKGMSKTGASAIVGTLQAESNLDPTIHAQMKGDNGEGLAQWTGSRKKNFWNTLERIEPGAQSKYKSIVNVPLERQLDVIMAERPDVTRAIHNAKDISTATDIMLRGYENGGGTIGSMASRKQMDNIYGKWNNGYNKQMSRRLGNASNLLGTHIDPSQYSLSQGFFNDTNAMINTEIPEMQFPNSMNVDPSTMYKAPIIDDTLFANPKAPTEEVAYSPKQEKLDNIQTFNTVMGLLGQSTPFTGLVENSKPGLLSYINAIYST